MVMTKAISSDNDIHLLSNVAKIMVGNLPINTYSTFQNNSCDNISKCNMGYYMLIPTWAPR
jgi:hypothetical protein